MAINWSGAKTGRSSSSAPNIRPASIRRFNPALCCEHLWSPIPASSRQFCARCDAECERDASGKIVDFDACFAQVLP